MGTLTHHGSLRSASALSDLPEDQAAPSMRVNGAPASGWIDLEHIEESGEAGYLCVQPGHKCTPVFGQVLSVHGPIRVAGTTRSCTAEFKVMSTWTCANGACARVAYFPIAMRDPRTERLESAGWRA